MKYPSILFSVIPIISLKEKRKTHYCILKTGQTNMDQCDEEHIDIIQVNSKD